MQNIDEGNLQGLADVHANLIQSFLRDGRLADMEEAATALDITAQELTKRLNDLSSLHGLVLHPHKPEPWVVHPFSTTPTAHFVESQHHGWWAPCIWCALGIAHLAGGKIRIHTRLGGEYESLVLNVEDGIPLDQENAVVHFSIPPRNAWNNVHQHCSLVLPFRSEADIAPWCLKHGQQYGEAVSVATTASLARRWYGPYANPQWRKWTVDQAQQIFQLSGLTSPFWELSGKGTY
jgi:hypothetical protein